MVLQWVLVVEEAAVSEALDLENHSVAIQDTIVAMALHTQAVTKLVLQVLIMIRMLMPVIKIRTLKVVEAVLVQHR